MNDDTQRTKAFKIPEAKNAMTVDPKVNGGDNLKKLNASDLKAAQNKKR